MVCRCGHSFVDPSRSPEKMKPREKYRRGDLSGFAVMFGFVGLARMGEGALAYHLAKEHRPDLTVNERLLAAGFFLVLGLAYWWVGWLVWKRKAVVYNPAMVFAAVGLCQFPVGLILGIFLLIGLSKNKHLLTKR